jgi:CAAX protease family protein
MGLFLARIITWIELLLTRNCINTISTKHHLILYFSSVFVISWSTWISAIILKTGAFTPILLLIGLFGPAISAIITTVKVSGVEGAKKLLASYKLLRFSPSFWLIGFLLIPLIFLMSAIVYPSSAVTTIFTSNSVIFSLASFVYLLFINSGEEIGWRGFALPRLQGLGISKKHNALIASLILGIIWAVWHLPIYLVPGQSSFPYPLFFAFTVGISIAYTAVYNNTKGSLFAVTAFHASTDIMPRILRIANFTVLNWSVITGLTWLAALILVISLGSQKL